MRMCMLAGVVTFVVATTTVASADEEQAKCIASYERGQQKKKEGRLLEARVDFEVCSRESCPELARRDCVGWLRETESAVPSIVVGARSANGLDVRDAELLVDERTSTARGAPIEVDPGEHRVRVRTADGRSAETIVIVIAGEKNRVVRLVVADPAPPPEKPAGAVESSSVAPFVLGGVAIVALGVGVTLDVMGSSDLRGLRRDCAPTCASSDVDAARATIIVGDTLVGIGLVTGAVAVYLALTRTKARTARAPWTFAW